MKKHLSNFKITSNKFELIFIITMSLLLLAFFIGLTSGADSGQGLIFFKRGADLFADFINPFKWLNKNYFTTGYIYANAQSYPPFPIILFYPFGVLLKAGGIAYTFMSIFLFLMIPTILISFLIYELKNGSKFKKLLIVFLLLFSGIYLTSLERANIIFYSAAAILYYLAFYRDKNKIFREISLIALAFAASIKIFPALLAILLLVEKRYFDTFKAFLYALILSITPFLIMPGGLLNIPACIKLAHIQVNNYYFLDPQFKFGLNGFLPLFTLFSSKFNFLIDLITPLKLISFIFSILGVFYIKQHWKKVLLVTILTVTTPEPSFLYTCLNLFFPLILLLNEQEHKSENLIYLVLFIIIFNPYQIVIGKNLSLNIIFANISVLLMQLMLCIEGLKCFYEKAIKTKLNTQEMVMKTD